MFLAESVSELRVLADRQSVLSVIYLGHVNNCNVMFLTTERNIRQLFCTSAELHA